MRNVGSRKTVQLAAGFILLSAWGLPSLVAQDIPAWQLVWSDEFEQEDGTAPNSSNWGYDVGGNGWGNNELQFYTVNRRQNARVEGGKLILEAHKEDWSFGGVSWDYTSARIKTQGRRSWTYGRFEARMKLTRGQGLWPAFWMVGANIGSVGWPRSGEIDIMENIGSEPRRIRSSLHGPSFFGATGSRWRDYVLADGTQFYEYPHLFAVEWEQDEFRWLVDTNVFWTLRRSTIPPSDQGVFDLPFFIIMNIAVGGDWPGAPTASTPFPQQLVVDYVRVYRRTQAPVPELSMDLVNNQILARWPGSFPQARLQRAAAPGAQWVSVPTDGRMDEGDFVATVEPGFYRLLVSP